MSSSPSVSQKLGADAQKMAEAVKPDPGPQGLALYSRFALAGAVCCSVTHGGLTPVDVYVPILQTAAQRPQSADGKPIA